MTTAPACLRPVIFYGATSPKPPRRAEQILLSTNLQMPKCQVIFCSLEEKKNDASGYLKEFLFFFLLSDVKAANGRFTPWVAFITWSFGAKLLSYIIVFMYYDTAFFCVFWLHRWNENLQAQSNQANIVRAQGILFFTITLPLSFYCEMNVSSLKYSVTKKEAVFLSIKRSKLPGMTRIWWCCKKRKTPQGCNLPSSSFTFCSHHRNKWKI